MNIIYIQGNTISFDGNNLSIDELYTTKFLAESDAFAVDVAFDSYFVNELFLNTFQPYLAFKQFVESENITTIILKKPSTLLHALSLDIAKSNNVNVKGGAGRMFLFKQRLRAHILFLATALYLVVCMIRIPRRKNVIKHPLGIFILSRSASAEKKLRNFSYPKHVEDFGSKSSMYSYYSVFRRVYWVVQSYWGAFRQIGQINTKVRQYAGEYSRAIAYSFYATRMVHTLLYEKLLNSFFRACAGQTLYTGNNLDRFSVVEEVMARKYGIHTVCIPHGLEYGFRFPKGFSGDVFYSTSAYAAEYLNRLYQTDKFTFDQSVAERMFSITSDKVRTLPKVVFFTEPRELEVNIYILQHLVPKLKSAGIQLYVKLHPKDKKSNYTSFDIQFMESLEEALVGNVCFARKSTTLLECTYNKSKAAAILTNAKDEALFYTFPSLQSNSIHITKSIDSLFAWIELNIKNKKHEQI